jgi:hypothetical protein
MTFMKRVYLVLAILPCIFFFQFFSAEGANFGGFVSAVLANGAAAGFTADLLFTSFVFWLAMIIRRREGKGPNPILFIVLNLTIGLSCAIPAYLYASSE